MHKLILIFLIFLTAGIKVTGQSSVSNPSAVHEYYIRLKGITSRQDVEKLQNIISKKNGISFFMANRYPVRFFLMRSDRAITAAEFAHFLDNISTSIEF